MRRYATAVVFVVWFLWHVAFAHADGWPVVRPVVDLSGWCSTAPAVVPAKSPVAVVRELPTNVAAPTRVSIIARGTADISPRTIQAALFHLTGPEHGAFVPAGELQGRSLRELLAIHGNLHAGWTWDGSSRSNGFQDAGSRYVQPVYSDAMMMGDCPNGQCAQPQGGVIRRGLFGWRR